MFSMGTWGEILIIAVIALIVIGPKDLPYALKQLGKWVRKLRLMQQELQSSFNDLTKDD